MGPWLLAGDSASVHIQRLGVELLNRGIDLHVASVSTDPLPGAVMHRLRPRGSTRRSYPLAAAELLRVARRVRPDVVNAHYVSSYGLMAAALPGRHRLVQTAWGTDLLVTARRRSRRPLASLALRRADLVTGDSDSLLREAQALAPDVPLHRFVFGPPQSLFAVRGPREPIVVSPRRHEPNYRIDLVLAAWEVASARLPGHRLVVSGSGTLTAALRTRAGAATEFVGELPYRQALDLVQRAQAVISVPLSDASSASVLEALAGGCSVLATDLDANREWLPASHLVPTDAGPETVAERLLAVIDEPTGLDPRWSFEHQVGELLGRIDGLTRG